MSKETKKSKLVVSLIILLLAAGLSYLGCLGWNTTLIFVMVGVGYKLHDPID